MSVKHAAAKRLGNGGLIKVIRETALVKPSQLQSELETFESLMRQYERQVYNVAYRMTGNREEAKDLTQEAFLRAFRAFRSYVPGTAFDRWLFRIVSNLYIDQVRRKSARKFRIESLDAPIRIGGQEIERTVPDSSMSPEEVLTEQEMSYRVQKALDELPPEFRMAVVLCDVQGFSYEEIASIMGCSIGTVRSRIHRARRALRSKLDPKGHNLSGAEE